MDEPINLKLTNLFDVVKAAKNAFSKGDLPSELKQTHGEGD